MDNLKKLLLSQIDILRQWTTNFVNYYQSNISLTQNRHHKTLAVIHAKNKLPQIILFDRYNCQENYKYHS